MEPTVVVGYDHLPSGERALLEAAREAARRGASLTVLTAFQWLTPVAPTAYAALDLDQSVRDAATEIAEHGAGVVRSRYPGMTVTPLVQDGPTADVLGDLSREAELLVVGNRGRGGFAGLLLGSVSLRTLGTSTVPTMVVRGSEHTPRDLVVAAVDVETPSEAALLEFAFTEASRRGARLEVLHVWDKPWFLTGADATEEVEAVVKEAVVNLDTFLGSATRPLQARFPEVHMTRRIVEGTPSAVLNEASHHADLVVVGAHWHPDRRHGMRVGPVAHGLLHHADCPVAVVPGG